MTIIRFALTSATIWTFDSVTLKIEKEFTVQTDDGPVTHRHYATMSPAAAATFEFTYDLLDKYVSTPLGERAMSDHFFNAFSTWAD